MEFMLWIAQAKAAKGGPMAMIVQFMPFIIIFALFWFMIIRPQRKRENELKAMLGALKKGDKIVTSSGIFGEVYELTPQTAVVEIAPKVKITLQRASIAGLVTPEVYAGIQQNVPAESKGARSGKAKSLKKKRK